jgi:hypothetical protein
VPFCALAVRALNVGRLRLLALCWKAQAAWALYLTAQVACDAPSQVCDGWYIETPIPGATEVEVLDNFACSVPRCSSLCLLMNTALAGPIAQVSCQLLHILGRACLLARM